MALHTTKVKHILRAALSLNLISEKERDYIAMDTLVASKNDADLHKRRLIAIRKKGIDFVAAVSNVEDLTGDEGLLIQTPDKKEPNYKSIW